MKHKILVTAPLDFLPDLKKRIGEEMEMDYAFGADRKRIIKMLSGSKYSAWMVAPCPTYFIDNELLTICPTIRMIATPSTGSDHIDVAQAQAKGIMVYALKGTREVEKITASSEFTFDLMISTVRRLPFAFNSVLQGNWREVEGRFRGRELGELTLGIIGFGRIGSNLAHYSSSFGMKIMAYDPYKKIEADQVMQVAALDEMLSQIDVLAVCVHLNPETKGMINDYLLGKLKTGAFFINTSRGEVVNEAALLRHLESGRIQGAGLDVISGELTGDKNEHPLIKYAQTHENLIITPHIAGLTYDSESKAQTAAYEAIRNFLNKEE